MSARRTQLAIAIAILSWSAVECYRSYEKLPEPMATNFGSEGVPGGWSSKRSFVTIYAVSVVFWLGALLAVPSFARRSRKKLGPENERWLGDTSGWFLVASVAFSAAVTHLVFEANLVTGRLSSTFVWLLIAYALYVVWWTVRVVGKLHRANRRA